MEIQVSSWSIRNKDSVKLLGIHINNSLNFDYHINQLCKRASKKLYALARIAKHLDINKRKMLMKAFVSSQFSYCPLIWMFHSKKMEHRNNNIRKWALKLVYQDSHDLTFQDLLAKDKLVSVHQKYLQLLATEIFKSKTGESPELINVIFQEQLYIKKKARPIVYHGSESLPSLAP